MVRELSALLSAALLLAGPAFADDAAAQREKRHQDEKEGKKDDKDDKKDDKKADKPVPVVGGTIFAHWGVDPSSDANGYNAFDLDRAYFFVKADLPKNLAARITLDADRQKSTTITVPDGTGGETDITIAADSKTRVFVKHAYLEWKTPAKGVKLRFGMEDTAWAPYVDNFTGFRYISKESGDLNKFLSTSDIGVQAMGEHAKGLVGWQVGLINGEGFGNPEIDQSKTLQARVTVDPLAQGGKLNLPINGYISDSLFSPAGSNSILQYGGGLGFKMPYVLFWGEYLGQVKTPVDGGDATKSSVMSFLVSPRVPKVINGIFRYDVFDPDTTADENQTTTLIGGVSRDFADKVSGSLTYEQASTAVAGADPVTTQGIFLRMMAGF